MTKESMKAGFHHVAIRVRDFDKSAEFYQQTLGLSQHIAWGEAPNRAIMLDTGNDNYLELFERPDQPLPSEEGVILHFALYCADPDELIERVRAADMQVTMEPKTVELPFGTGKKVMRIAFFKGPDGELIELFKPE